MSDDNGKSDQFARGVVDGRNGVSKTPTRGNIFMTTRASAEYEERYESYQSGNQRGTQERELEEKIDKLSK